MPPDQPKRSPPPPHDPSQLQLPHLRDFVAELAANKKMAGYLAHKRMPRNAPWDGGYASFKPGRTVLKGKDEL